MKEIEIRTFAYSFGEKAGLSLADQNNLYCQLLKREERAEAIDSLIAECKTLIKGGDVAYVPSV